MRDALRLQLEWGADEALLDQPQDRRLVIKSASLSPPARQSTAEPPATTTLLAGPAEAERLAATCTTLSALRQALADFTGCALAATATQLVFADGPETARLMIIGEAPGAEEDRAGVPFVGQAGQLLNKMLASIGLERSAVRIVNTVPWRPPGNRNPTESEISLCLPFLRRHIALLRPDCLVVLGAVAAKAMLDSPERSAGIRRQRGIWRSLQITGLDAPMPCLPSYHPAYLLRTPEAKKDAWLDLISVRAWLEDH